jgi:hypothetical protein
MLRHLKNVVDFGRWWNFLIGGKYSFFVFGMEITLQKLLLDHEKWPSRYLRWDLRAARLDIPGGIPCWVPFSRLWRLLNYGARLRIDDVIVPGIEIKFSNVLEGDRSFVGLVEPEHTIPFEKFLKIDKVEKFYFFVSDTEGTGYWQVSHIVLTHLTEVVIRTSRYD